MTEEERILYLEQKALAEEEMRKKKEEILMMFLKVIFKSVQFVAVVYSRKIKESIDL